MTSGKSNIIFRYIFIVSCILMVCVAIQFMAFKTVFIEGAYWQKKADSLKIEDLIVLPTRGNILAQDGRLMASTIPQYYLYMDFQADGLKLDTLEKYLTPLSRSLSGKLKDKSVNEYKAHILKGLRSKSRQYLLCRKKVSYLDLQDIRTFPFLVKGPNKSGFYTKEMVQREKPFGSLASRTIGSIYGEYEKGGKNGLELQYDSLLTGIPGTSSKQKVRGRWVNVNVIDPEDGMDVKTTIDIEIQDITEKALVDMLRKIDAASGTAVVMEVKTGEVKSITNIERVAPGEYAETKNHAVADEIEPGSTFKVASMMVALDAGIVSPDDVIDTGSGVYMYAGSRMTDHNWHKGGYGAITAAQAIWYSSNIGVAKIILKGFERNPEAYVEKLYKIGLNRKMDLEIPGAGSPKIRHPRDKDRWYKTTLPWMSFGYETQIPPIYTLTFFNAIANDGKMIKPVFVKEICRNGSVIEKKETEVINSSVCSSSTLDIIRQMLIDVVDKGTGTAVKSEHFVIAGKTGTAQISQGRSGYAGGGHQVSFCGYFPADRPQYSCIVVIRSPRNGYPSGGTMSGGVFKNIAEQIYAHSEVLPVTDKMKDTVNVFHPLVLNGDYKQTIKVLRELDVDYRNLKDRSSWIRASIEDDKVEIKDLKSVENLIPNVVGMGAKDALYILENAGLYVHLSGYGRVRSQSVPAGSRIMKGQTVALTLR